MYWKKPDGPRAREGGSGRTSHFFLFILTAPLIVCPVVTSNVLLKAACSVVKCTALLVTKARVVPPRMRRLSGRQGLPSSCCCRHQTSSADSRQDWFGNFGGTEKLGRGERVVW